MMSGTLEHVKRSSQVFLESLEELVSRPGEDRNLREEVNNLLEGVRQKIDFIEQIRNRTFTANHEQNGIRLGNNFVRKYSPSSEERYHQKDNLSSENIPNNCRPTPTNQLIDNNTGHGHSSSYEARIPYPLDAQFLNSAGDGEDSVLHSPPGFRNIDPVHDPKNSAISPPFSQDSSQYRHHRAQYSLQRQGFQEEHQQHQLLNQQQQQTNHPLSQNHRQELQSFQHQPNPPFNHSPTTESKTKSNIRQQTMRSKFLEKEGEKESRMYAFKSLDDVLGRMGGQLDERAQCLKSINEIMNQQFVDRDLYGRVSVHIREENRPMIRELKRGDYDFIFDRDAFDKKVQTMVSTNRCSVINNPQEMSNNRLPISVGLNQASSSKLAELPFMLFEKVFLARRLSDGSLIPGKKYHLVVVPGECSRVWDQPQEKTLLFMCTDALLVLAVEYYSFMSSSARKFTQKSFVDAFHTWVRQVTLQTVSVIDERVESVTDGMEHISFPLTSRSPFLNIVARSSFCSMDVDPSIPIFRKNKLDGKVPLLASVFRLLYYTIAKIGALLQVEESNSPTQVFSKTTPHRQPSGDPFPVRKAPQQVQNHHSAHHLLHQQQLQFDHHQIHYHHHEEHMLNKRKLSTVELDSPAFKR